MTGVTWCGIDLMRAARITLRVCTDSGTPYTIIGFWGAVMSSPELRVRIAFALQVALAACSLNSLPGKRPCARALRPGSLPAVRRGAYAAGNCRAARIED